VIKFELNFYKAAAVAISAVVVAVTGLAVIAIVERY
jgi:hypothetical protein